MNPTIKLLIALLFCLQVGSHAEVTVSGIFTDDMILQRNKPVNVWGTADSNEEIQVSINGQLVKTKARDGKWKVTLKPMTAGGPYTLKIDGSNKIDINNVLVGDIWLCGGQSNMDYDILVYMKNRWYKDIAAEYTKIAHEPNAKIRLALMNKISTLPTETKVPMMDDAVFNSKWQMPSEKVTPRMSAVGYVFAKGLQEYLGIPIGLIDANKGGSFIKFWEPPHARKARGESRPAKNMFNAMLHTYKDFPIKGFIWYQGESDAINLKRAKDYKDTFQRMIEGWRHEFNDPEIPFLYVQLAGFERNPYMHGITYPALRDSQTAALKLKNTAMAVAYDLGLKKDIHPPFKIEVSRRLLLAAKKVAYGESIVYSGPVYKSHVFKGSKAIVSFEHSGSGLLARKVTLEKREIPQGQLEGFELSGKDQIFHTAKAVIEKDKVILTSPEVSKPVAIRYAYRGFPYANLYNQEGLPAVPFRTDDFEIKFSQEDSDLYSRNLILPASFQRLEMTLEQKRKVCAIYDKHLNKTAETKRRELWNLSSKVRREKGMSSTEAKQATDAYNNFLKPILTAMEKEITQAGIFE
ncbi:MAG: sialate O-acetylesterase [Lentisphaerales bacterium]|nr:sialate O-acetylesterase [Lentisphaerales bacterium]